ncbi:MULTISPECIES: hypothetical protein [unclassified Neptuniibacter]|uniref:hypothetical protein n=1 Tax=unclassified Neptuniibacter TaxID=2630693 RepID=UPI0025E0B4F2|nr:MULTISPECIES: hypothetical protein [unclassified Neptuniibacter]|tara:strand:- start:1811 stop:2017 length:207 start_codon:yes stop_codon:yes gene_type:complete
MEKIKLYSTNNDVLDAKDKRKIAVEAALELIHVRTASDAGSVNIKNHLKCLGEYADLIQEALEVENND